MALPFFGKKKEEEVVVDDDFESKFSIDLQPKPMKLPKLPELTDVTVINVRYPLIPPYANAHIYWDKEIQELVYYVEEPKLSDTDLEILKLVQLALEEMINISYIKVIKQNLLIQYLERNVQSILAEFGAKVSEDTYKKIMYYIYRDAVGLNEIEPLMSDYFIEDIECNGFDYPIFVVHRKYGNMRTNIIYKDHEKLTNFVEKIAQRTGRYISYAKPLLDGTLPDGSIDYEEPVIYRSNGIVKVDKIGKVIDGFYENESSDKPVEVTGLEVPAFDKDTLKISWKKVDYVYRHKQNESIYEIKTEFGKKLKLTGCHSIFVLRKKGLRAERTDTLNVGDYVAIPLLVPENPVIKEVNIAEKLSVVSQSDKMVLGNVPVKVYIEKEQELYGFFRRNYNSPNKRPDQAFYEHKKKRILPVKLHGLLNRQELQGTRIKTTSSIGVKPLLKVDEDLMAFLGLYVAVGRLIHTKNHRKIQFCLNANKVKLIDKIKSSAMRCFGVEVYVEPLDKNSVKVNSVRVTINSYVLYHLLKDVLNLSAGAKNKRVPEIVFNISKELQQVFLRFWSEGGHGSTASKQLIQDIAYLSLFNKDTVEFYDRKRKPYINQRPDQRPAALQEHSNFFVRSVKNEYKKTIPIEIFNPLRNTHLCLRNKRISRERLRVILNDLRYKRFQNLKLANSKFIKEWTKRSFIKNGKLTEKGSETLYEREVVKKISNSDLGFEKIISIRKVKSTSGLVYDFSVNGHENFIGGTGGLCCHNSRVNATYTDDVTTRGPTFTIRRFTSDPWTPIHLMDHLTLNAEGYAFLWLAIENKMNIMIVGETASGKTTFLNSILFFVPPEARITSIEDTRELNLNHDNWLPAVTRSGFGIPNMFGKTYGEITLFDLLRESFRQNPDYVVLGETRGKETYVLFQGMASGHPSYATFHAASVETLVRRLSTPPINLPPSLIESLDIICVAAHIKDVHRNFRRIKGVYEVIEVDQNNKVNHNAVIQWVPTTDKHVYTPASHIVNRMSNRLGTQKKDIENEIKLRADLLRKVMDQKIFDYREVSGIINSFYKNRAAVLKRFGLKYSGYSNQYGKDSSKISNLTQLKSEQRPIKKVKIRRGAE